MSESEEFARALRALPEEITLTVSRELAVQLIAVVQLASRHPGASGSPSMAAVVRMARALQDGMAERAPHLGRLLEKGWRPVFDVPREG